MEEALTLIQVILKVVLEHQIKVMQEEQEKLDQDMVVVAVVVLEQSVLIILVDLEMVVMVWHLQLQEHLSQEVAEEVLEVGQEKEVDHLVDQVEVVQEIKILGRLIMEQTTQEAVEVEQELPQEMEEVELLF